WSQELIELLRRQDRGEFAAHRPCITRGLIAMNDLSGQMVVAKTGVAAYGDDNVSADSNGARQFHPDPAKRKIDDPGPLELVIVVGVDSASDGPGAAIADGCSPIAAGCRFGSLRGNTELRHQDLRPGRRVAPI